VWTTRAMDVIKTNMQGHKLGVGFIWQVKHDRTYREHYGTKRQAQEAASQALHVG